MALQKIPEKGVRELGDIMLIDSLVSVILLQLSSPARSIATVSLFEVDVSSCSQVPYLRVSARRS
jgi:hypothetical protein